MILFLFVISTNNFVFAQKNEFSSLPGKVQDLINEEYSGFNFSSKLLESTFKIPDDIYKDYFDSTRVSPYFLQGDFNGDGKADYLVNLFKVEDLGKNNSIYSKGISLKAVIIYSKESEYLIYSESLPWSSGILDTEKPTSRHVFGIISPGEYKVRPYYNDGVSVIKISHPSIGIINGEGMSIIYWVDGKFTTSLVYSGI